MALFPAYLSVSEEDRKNNGSNTLLSWKDEDLPSEAVESQLLASDTDEESEKYVQNNAQIMSNIKAVPSKCDEYYLDSICDYGNLNVSTLYYPGRPEYYCKKGKIDCKKNKRYVRRYYTSYIPHESDATAVTQRADAYQLLLAQNPQDVALWEKFIDFQEVCGSAESALAAAEQAAERVPGSAVLLQRLLDALEAALPPRELLGRLRALLAAEPRPEARLPLWERLLAALGGDPAADADAATAAAAAALADTRAALAAYPRLLYAAGLQLRAAGLWERLVLLLELAVAMNLPTLGPAPAFPPPFDPEAYARAELRLQEIEDEATASGLPLSAVWVRVERARAAAHWRPAPAGPPPADPQRAPPPHLLADLLRPLAGPPLPLAARLLRLAKVPPLPVTDWAARALGPPPLDCAEEMLPLLAAAADLPPAHPARAAPAVARRLLALALDPPHYFSDEWGHLSWTEALWDACCAATTGAARGALLAWRLRWLRAHLLLTEEDGAGRGERARVRSAARAALRRLRCSDPLVVAELARLELLAEGGAAAARTARLALRSAIASCPVEHAIYVARVVGEVESDAGEGALVYAVLGRATDAPPSPPAPADRVAALQRCEERCAELERRWAAGEGAGADEEAGEEWALLPGAGEWARARAALADPRRRRRLLAALLAAAPAAPPPAARYYEEAAEALVRAAAAEGRAAVVARAVAPLYPNNAYLAVAEAGAPLWAMGELSAEARARALAGGGGLRPLAGALPALLRALTDAGGWGAAARVLRRATVGARGARAGALVWALRLEAEARAGCGAGGGAACAAAARPGHKWLYVRGAALCGADAPALEDAILERRLRLHALRDELPQS
ncbi:uncharacterized protein LOC121730653 [Aricia agestis]|uniref:uncharacterized protein LOC121730653 n=1 Tax=Aricia agestis TaxID=91739 RepID=UPI001C20A0EA|nr:uncharacterized protein LOC121730653 [Aricia agestis]